MLRIGLGQDSHPFAHQSSKPLVLGGVVILPQGGLKANSDGDVILHSLCNALSSAIGGDSLGTWADELCLRQGITDSQVYVKEIVEKLNHFKWEVVNVAIGVEAKKPKLLPPTILKMKQIISELLGISHDQVGITFTSGEGLTAFGKGQGMQALSIVLLQKND